MAEQVKGTMTLEQYNAGKEVVKSIIHDSVSHEIIDEDTLEEIATNILREMLLFGD